MKSNEESETPSALANQLADLEFLFVTGKGGVGKSTVAAVLALAAAERGKRVLVVHPEGSQPHDGLWEKHIGPHPESVIFGVDAVTLNAEQAMREYTSAVLKSDKVTGALFSSKVARGFLTGMPGLSDWAILGKAWSWTQSGATTLPVGQTAYDQVILDAPASGDASKMLRVPQVIAELAPGGRFRTDADACSALLKDRTRSAMILVSLAEHLVVTETEENLSALQDELKLPIGPLVLNRVLEKSFTLEDAALLERSLGTEGVPWRDTWTPAQIGFAHSAREKRQAAQIRRLTNLGLPILKLPELSNTPGGLAALKKLQMGLAASD